MIAALLTFVALVALDFCWALYTEHLTQGSAHTAAGWAVVLYALSASATIGYTSNHWLLIPACLGSYVGTYIGVRWNKRKKS